MKDRTINSGNMGQFIVILILLGSTSHLEGAPAKVSGTMEVPTNDAPGLSVGQGLSDKIYQRTVDGSSIITHASVTMDSSLRLYFPSQFNLKNEHFNVSYSDNTSRLVGFMIGPQFSLAEFSQVKINSFLHTGFAYSQGIYNIESDSGLMARDEIELQWVPIQTGLEVKTRSFTNQNVNFGLFSSVGMDFYTQTGRLDGVNQSFWSPRYELGSSITVFASDRKGVAGFDGVRLSGIYYKSFASQQLNRGWATDLGAKYAF